MFFCLYNVINSFFHINFLKVTRIHQIVLAQTERKKLFCLKVISMILKEKVIKLTVTG